MQRKKRDIKDVLSDVKNFDFAEAKARAKAKKNPIQFLLIVFGFGFSGMAFSFLFWSMWNIHTMMYPMHAGRFSEFWHDVTSTATFASSFMLVIPLLLASFVLGFLISDLFFYYIPFMRKLIEKNVNLAQDQSFEDAVYDLWTITKIFLPPMLLLSFIGAATLRNLT